MTELTAAALAEAIARVWPRLEICFPDVVSWRDFSVALLTLLRRLDDSGESQAVCHEVVALFARNAVAYAELKSALARPGVPEPGKPTVVAPSTPVPKVTGAPGSVKLRSPWGSARERATPAERPLRDTDTPADVSSPKAPSTASTRRHTMVSVLYGTDRARASGDSVRYTNDLSNELSLGVATVSIPDDHEKGRLERPRWYRLEFRENNDRHVVIASLGALDHDQFVAEAAKARERDGSIDEALIFVHGYNVGFDDAIRRAAQFAVDLEFRGLAMAYSWPSTASLFGYAADANVSESSMFVLARFIELVRTELGFQRVHLVAHSMGSRLLARALNQHVLTPPQGPRAQLNQVVFAAPDIDPRTFSGFAKVFTQACKRTTLYASSHDLALTASSWIYRRRRGGDADAGWVTHGVDTVDASKVDDSLMGHSYFSNRRSVLADLHEVIEYDRDPGDRFGLTEVKARAGRYWAFKA